MIMWTIDGIKEFGFIGFVKIDDLMDNYDQIPEERGVYLIVKPINGLVEFLRTGSGGFYKQKNPNVAIELLRNNWVENSIVLYVGQAGGIVYGNWSNSTLRKRLKDYMKFGKGEPVAHSGGRYIWQIESNRELIVSWKALPNKVENPRSVEKELIRSFKRIHNLRPFANLKD